MSVVVTTVGWSDEFRSPSVNLTGDTDRVAVQVDSRVVTSVMDVSAGAEETAANG
jgi:hypothetical protein